MSGPTADGAAPRGTPPNDKQIAKHLGADRLPLWESVLAVIKEFGATSRWMHSENTGSWSYRSYLSGERFFTTLTLTDAGFELSVNLKPEEWGYIGPVGTAARAKLDALQEQALASGDDPAWVHVPVESETDIHVVSQLLLARGRRVQAPRTKKRKR